MAFSSSITLPLICPKGKIGFTSNNHCMLGKLSSRSCASLFNRRPLRTATTAIEAVPKQESSPWLMLPPETETGTTSYKFYSLADDKVEALCLSDQIRDLRLTCRGSSHGWLALLSQHDDGFFLYNPISRRHIKLPSILNLPTDDPDDDILTSARYVNKVILSCSPDDEDKENCRVLIFRDCENLLAFCCPGRSQEWTLMFDENRDEKGYYIDCVYSTRLKLFLALTHDNSKSWIETWDLGCLSSPKLIKVDKYNYFPMVEKLLYCRSERIEHLVVADEDLLLVIQYIMFDSYSYDSEDEPRQDEHSLRYMTIGFDIFKYDDSEKGKFKYLDRLSLGDLAIFVGLHNHSVAIQATHFPELKPNSIYFTDGMYTGKLEGDDDDVLWGGGHDIGIYNYQDKTVSSCYYPCDVPSLKNILPAPIWFFPN
ncbi:hypothetical protein CASFOL_026507 [Castilleja foliolosa]|uniref:KIB1-4 beta-propeller domain-containing protein n=1 Tax=Castilleja foliolosa TaxID=1961234 RepID=A0ABD3CHB5_9LAMI